MSDDTDAAAAMRRDLAAAEAEVARLTTRAEKAEAERDAAVIDLGEQAENFREVLDAELTRSETAEAEVARLREVLVAVDAKLTFGQFREATRLLNLPQEGR